MWQSSCFETRLFRLPFAVGLALACLSFVSSVHADEPASVRPAESFDALSEAERQELDTFVQNGLEAYDRRNFEKSLTNFQRALEILEHSDFVYRIALAYERLGELEPALEHYRRFLEMAPETDDRPEIERTIEQLEEKIARQQPTVAIRTHPSGAAVRVENRDAPLGTTPLEATLPPGEHTLIVSKSGLETIERRITLETGEATALEYDLTADTPLGEASRAGPLTMLGGGGIAAVASGLSYMRFAKLRGEVREQKGCIPNCSTPDSFYSNVQRQKTWEAVAWSTGAVAAGALTGGAVWMILTPSGTDSEPSARTSGVRIFPAMVGGAPGFNCSIRPNFRSNNRPKKR